MSISSEERDWKRDGLPVDKIADSEPGRASVPVSHAVRRKRGWNRMMQERDIKDRS